MVHVCSQYPDLSGVYAQVGSFHARPVYRKVLAPTAYLYGWQEQNDPSKDGWWLGAEVGGHLVYARHPSRDVLPPQDGWHIPWQNTCVGNMQVHCVLPSHAVSGHPIGAAADTEARPPESRVAAALRTSPWRRSGCMTQPTLENRLRLGAAASHRMDMPPPVTAHVPATGSAVGATQAGEAGAASSMIRLQTQNAELCSLVRRQHVQVQELLREQLSTQSGEIRYLRGMLAQERPPPPVRLDMHEEMNQSRGLQEPWRVPSHQHTPQPRHRGKPGGKKHVKKTYGK